MTARPPFSRLHHEVLVDNAWHRYCMDRYVQADGSEGVYYHVDMPGSCAAIPVFDDGSTALLRVFRYLFGAEFWEFPIGGMRRGDDPLTVAKRELHEEAGLVAATELTERGRKVIVLDQEPEASLGGQDFWSLGGLFFVDSPEQRRMGIRDSHELALQDWMGTAAFDRDEDHWPRQWAEAYVSFAHQEKRGWLHAMGMRWFPIVGWAERGGYGAMRVLDRIDYDAIAANPRR